MPKSFRVIAQQQKNQSVQQVYGKLGTKNGCKLPTN